MERKNLFQAKFMHRGVRARELVGPVVLFATLFRRARDSVVLKVTHIIDIAAAPRYIRSEITKTRNAIFSIN